MRTRHGDRPFPFVGIGPGWDRIGRGGGSCFVGAAFAVDGACCDGGCCCCYCGPSPLISGCAETSFPSSASGTRRNPSRRELLNNKNKRARFTQPAERFRCRVRGYKFNMGLSAIEGRVWTLQSDTHDVLPPAVNATHILSRNVTTKLTYLH